MASVMFLQISFLAMTMMGYLGIAPSQAFNYYVGGKDGWSLNPSKSFNDWASQNRFQVHDSLVFKYKNATDSVLQVNQDDYNTCNTNNPILTLKNNGDSSTFKLDHSGLFFFISGNSENCNKGQKIIILVIGGARIKCTKGHHNPNHIVQLGAPVNNTCGTHKNIVVFLKVGGARAPRCPNVAPPLILVMAPRHASPAPAPSPAPLQGSHSPEISTPPGISPAASVPSEAAAPFPQGPSRAPPPDDGKSASAPALRGDLVTAVMLFMLINS